LSNTRGIFSASGVSDTERIDLLHSACEVVTDDEPRTRAQLLALLASETIFSEDLTRRQAWADEAIDLARRSRSGLTLASAINSVLLAIATPANLTERLRLCDEAVAAAQDCGDPWVVFWANNLLGFTRAQTGDLAWANDAYDRSRAIAGELDQPILVWLTTYLDAGLVLMAGDTSKAEQMATRALELGGAIGEPDAFSIFAAQFATIRLVQGRSDEIVDLLAQETETNGIPAFRGLLASVYCDLDRPDDARAVLEPLVEERFASVPENFLWLPTICLAADPISQLEWAEPAGWLAEWLLPYADQIPHTGPVLQGSIAYYAGNLLLAAGRHDEGLALLDRAEATHQRMGAAWYLARTRLALGSWLARTGRDRDRAAAALNQALVSATAHDYPVVERRVVAALSDLGHR
jgi:tetratricopeptide (TPR) repeat protein